MAPREGLTHLKEYDIKDSNVELIGTDIDHRVKYNSASTEPAWNDGRVGQVAGLYIWRIEDFEVVAWPVEKCGQFYDGDSYIVLHSYKVGEKEKLVHEIFFWLGAKTSQDEAGTAAYKTVELDEFLRGSATQHREIQSQPSEDFLALFPRLKILSGGVKSGFRHVEEEAPKEITTLLRIFKQPAAGRADSVVVVEVEPTWRSLDEGDVFVLDKGEKIWVWQGSKCSPMEKAKAAQVVSEMTLAKHIEVEVLAQTDARSRILANMLGADSVTQHDFKSSRPLASAARDRPRKLFRLSDASGRLSFDLVKDGQPIKRDDLDSNDVFLLDIGNAIWIWRGSGASKAERAAWLNVAQSYVRQLQERSGNSDANSTPFAAVTEGNESPAFYRAIEV